MGRSGGFKTAKAILGENEIRIAGITREKAKEATPLDYIESFKSNPYNLSQVSPLPNILSNTEHLLLAKSNTLIDFSSPTKKEYRCFIIIARDKRKGEITYQTVALYGPGKRGHAQGKIYYSGPSLEEARSIGQGILEKKISKGYTVTHNGYETSKTGLDQDSFKNQLP